MIGDKRIMVFTAKTRPLKARYFFLQNVLL